MDLFDLHAVEGGPTAALAPALCRWLIISFASDRLFPPAQSGEIAAALQYLAKEHRHATVETKSGHDAFVPREDAGLFADLVRDFLGDAAHSSSFG